MSAVTFGIQRLPPRKNPPGENLVVAKFLVLVGKTTGIHDKESIFTWFRNHLFIISLMGRLRTFTPIDRSLPSCPIALSVWCIYANWPSAKKTHKGRVMTFKNAVVCNGDFYAVAKVLKQAIDAPKDLKSIGRQKIKANSIPMHFIPCGATIIIQATGVHVSSSLAMSSWLPYESCSKTYQ